ncbi:MAG: hypothetical protein Q9207_002487 [Kuettlingeria erythrocarpa]
MGEFDIWSRSSNSVESWLAGQPVNLRDYKPSESSKRDRSPPHGRSHLSKRRCLGEIEGDLVQMPPKKGQQASPSKRAGLDPTKKQQQASPTKKKKDVGSLPGSFTLRSSTKPTPDEAVFNDDDDDDQEDDNGNDSESQRTPKPRRKTLSLNDPPKLDPPDANARDSRSHDGSTSTDRKRSPSPRKTRYNMTLAEIQVISVAIGSGDAAFPTEVQQLYDDLVELQTRQALIPASIRDRARQQLGVRDRDHYFSQESESTERESAQKHLRSWQDALDVRDAAGEYATDDTPESSWNMDVNIPLLRLALRDHWKSQEIWYKDLTSSRIYDKELLPKVPGITQKSKMVDLGIVIKPRRLGPLWKKVAGKCSDVAYQTVNQTDATHVSQTPIAISGEVKRAGGDEAESFVQLGTWATAHYAHLQILLENSANTDAALPALPLLQVIGDRWRLIIAEMKLDEGQIILHSDIELGSSKDILGIYQIIASIRRLAKWTSEQYRPWWTATILSYDESKIAGTHDARVDPLTKS